MNTRADDLNGDGDLPQPGTEEPKEPKEPKDGANEGSVEGPGNVSVDEPTAPALEDDGDSDEGESPSEEEKDDDDDDDESSSDDG